jgi:hypothetical protein
MQDKKLSFADVKKQAQIAKNNSDLMNLASALEYVAMAEQELLAIKNDINTMANAIEQGKLVDVDELSKLFDRAARQTRSRR